MIYLTQINENKESRDGVGRGEAICSPALGSPRHTQASKQTEWQLTSTPEEGHKPCWSSRRGFVLSELSEQDIELALFSHSQTAMADHNSSLVVGISVTWNHSFWTCSRLPIRLIKGDYIDESEMGNSQAKKQYIGWGGETNADEISMSEK